MILSFPSRNVLHFAVAAGRVPAEVVQAPLRVVINTDGSLQIEFSFRSTKKVRDGLAAIGVEVVTELTGEARKHSHWLQLFPLIAAPMPEMGPQTPVLFVLPIGEVPRLVTEMLRLSNDRQSLVSLADGRVLIKVTAPPYYTLLQAVETVGRTEEALRRDPTAPAMSFAQTSDLAKPRSDLHSRWLTAYFQASPGVWIEAGFTHPFAASLVAAEQTWVLVGASGQWETIEAPAFADLYDTLGFTLPAQDIIAPESSPLTPIQVPLALVRADAEPAALWVFDRDADASLQAFVETSDSQLIERLSFAVAGSTIVLRSRSKEPPLLALPNATSYSTVRKLPNLFAPTGTRLHPPIRRDIVARLLAEDADRVVWLAPAEAAHFTPRSILESAFRPLADWVEYVCTRESEALTAWMNDATFEFESFLIADPIAPARAVSMPKTSRPPRATEPKTVALEAAAELPEVSPANGSVVEIPSVSGDWQLRCDQLEKEFLAIDGSLDDLRRRKLWPALAEANAALGPARREEAILCRLNVLWNLEEVATPWPMPIEASLSATPTHADLQDTIALALGLSDEALRPRLPELQIYAVEHDDQFPLRAAWLIALRFAALSGGDPLGLSRARDRLTLRLIERGLDPENDLPAFLRFAGVKNSEQVRLVSGRIAEVHRAVQEWTAASLAEPGATSALIDLLFAWGLASLGETTAAHGLVENARRVLVRPDIDDELAMSSTFLFGAYDQRIGDALAGRRHGSPLAADLAAMLDEFRDKKAGVTNSPHGQAEYAIERLRERSAILEPHETLNAQREYSRSASPLATKLYELSTLRQPATLAKRIRECYRGVSPEDRIAVLLDAVPLSPRVGPDFMAELLALVPPAITATARATSVAGQFAPLQARLLARSLRLADFLERNDLFDAILKAFFSVLIAKPMEVRCEMIGLVARSALRPLRKPQRREQLHDFIQRLHDALEGSQPQDNVKALRAHLAVSAARLTLDEPSVAVPVLDAARQAILAPGSTLKPVELVELVTHYLSAVGLGRAEFTIPRLLDLFANLDPSRVLNRLTTARHYSLFHLQLAEEAVLALASDDSEAGRESRRWLEEDELLVRRRIHADVHRLVGQQPESL